MATPKVHFSEEDIKRKIRSNEFILINKDSDGEIWKKFRNCCFNRDKKKNVGYVRCNVCEHFLTYNSKSGTSHLIRHKCKSKVVEPNIEAFFSPVSSKLPTCAKDSVIDACIDFCCLDLRPFDVVAGKGFQKCAEAFIKIGAQYGNVKVTEILPHPTTISRKVRADAEMDRQEFATLLKPVLENGTCAVTTDLWTDDYKKLTYLTLTIHYTDSDWKINVRVLFTCEFSEDRKTGDCIRCEIQRHFAKVNRSPEMTKILIFFTDKGSNVVNALQSYTRLNCAAHSLNTTLRHTFDNKYLGSEMPRILCIISSVKSLVTYLKQSGLVTKLSKTVYQDIETRWNSKYTMLQSISEMFNEIEQLLNEREESFRMADLEHLEIAALINFLEPFNDASVDLEGEKYPTLPLVLLWRSKLEKHLTTTPGDSEDVLKLKIRARGYLADKFNVELLHRKATFLWPNFRTLRMLPASEIENVHCDIRRLMSEEVLEADSVRDENVDDTPQVLYQRKKLASISKTGRIFHQVAIKC